MNTRNETSLNERDVSFSFCFVVLLFIPRNKNCVYRKETSTGRVCECEFVVVMVMLTVEGNNLTLLLVSFLTQNTHIKLSS